MLTAARKVQRYVADKSYEDYLGDELLRDAVERNIEIIGEAARKVSEDLKSEHGGIPWRKIIAQRNVLVHEYAAIRPEEIWDVASAHIPRLIHAIEPLIPPLPPEPEA